VVSVILLLDSSFALLALPVSSAARGIVAVRAPRLSRCTLGQQGEGLQQRECASRPLGRRAFTSAASALLIALPFSAPSLAVAEDCSYAALTTLPAALTKVNSLATGDPKVALAGLQAEPLLANTARLSTALDACAADEKAKQDTLKKYNLMREEIAFQAGKNYDARWADPDDMSDMQSSIKKAKAALEGFLATVPAEQRGST